MAHLAHALPWTTLSTSLLATKHGPRGTPDRITVLSPDPSPAAQKQRRHFTRAFVRTLAAFSATERRKHLADPLATAPPSPSTEDQADADDPAIFADTTAAALQRHLASPHAHASLDSLSPRRGAARASGWAPLGGYADPRAELVMAMVAAGEVLPLLRLARWRAPGEQRSQLAGLWSYPGANPGWSNVAVAALEAYLFLNVVFLREELWMVHEGEGGEGKGRGFQRDYRDDGAFRSMLSDCTRYQDGSDRSCADSA
ncbi:uncharacterized protein K452DRAFT_360695 [Neofusicoccum parvum]|nr:uncharacterized protein K452DRAFT_360695 [Neofusicoccum parvum]